ncbi:MAG: hypothetical protein ABIP21_12820 [Acidimicrobiia bacterium]
MPPDFAYAWVMSLLLGGGVLALVASVEWARHFRLSAAMTVRPVTDERSAESSDIGPGPGPP